MEWTSRWICDRGMWSVACRVVGVCLTSRSFMDLVVIALPNPLPGRILIPQSRTNRFTPEPRRTFNDRLSRSSSSATSSGWSSRFVPSTPVTCHYITRAGSSCARLVFVVRCQVLMTSRRQQICTAAVWLYCTSALLARLLLPCPRQLRCAQKPGTVRVLLLSLSASTPTSHPF